MRDWCSYLHHSSYSDATTEEQGVERGISQPYGTGHQILRLQFQAGVEDHVYFSQLSARLREIDLQENKKKKAS